MKWNDALHDLRSGMTLIELLVVVTIMVLLLAVSVPIIRPMLESQQTHHAAHVLAGAMRQARTKAIESGESYGVRIIPYKNTPTASIELRLHKNLITRLKNPENIRVRVVQGVLVPWYYYNPENDPNVDDFWYETTWQSGIGRGISGTDLSALIRDFDLARNNFERASERSDSLISFDVGPPFRLAKQGNDFVLLFDHTDDEIFAVNFPDDPIAPPANYGLSIPASGPFALAWLPPTVMPHRTIVDLSFSGGETVNFWGEPKGLFPYENSREIPARFFFADENITVNDFIISFSPAGHVDCVYVLLRSVRDGREIWRHIKVNEMLYFCVGDWNRQVDVNNNTLSADGKSNLESPATYWVTIHARTGSVRVAPNAPISEQSVTELDRIRDARRIASEYFFDVGR